MSSFSIDHIGLHCHEKKSLSDFYEDVLGCKKIKTFTLSSHLHHKIFGGNEDIEVFVYEHDQYRFEIFVGSKKNHGCGHLCIEVEDREEFAKICEQKKISVLYFKKGLDS